MNDFKASKALMSIYTQDFKPFNNAKKVKKKKQHKDKRNSRDFANPANGVNIAEVGEEKKKKKGISEILCYNYIKKRHFATKCPKSQKSKN